MALIQRQQAALGQGTVLLILSVLGMLGTPYIAASEIACIAPLSEFSADPGTKNIPSRGIVVSRASSSLHGALILAAQSPSGRQMYLLQDADGSIISTPFHSNEMGSIKGTYGFTDGRLLIAAEKGLFLAYPSTGSFKFDSISDAGTGSIYSPDEIPGFGLLISTQNGLFLARQIEGRISIEKIQPPNVPTPSGIATRVEALPGMGWLIDFGSGEYFLAQVSGGGLTLRNATFSYNGFASAWGQTHRIAGLGVLVNDPATGMSLVRIKNGNVQIDPIGDQVVERIRKVTWIPRLGLYIDTGHATLFADVQSRPIKVILASTTGIGAPRLVENFSATGQLISASKGLFLLSAGDQVSVLNRISADNDAREFATAPGLGALLGTPDGLKLVRATATSATVEDITPSVNDRIGLPAVTTVGNRIFSSGTGEDGCELKHLGGFGLGAAHLMALCGGYAGQ